MKTAQASLDAGRQAFQHGDYAKAANEFLPLARKGDASAQYYVGVMFH